MVRAPRRQNKGFTLLETMAGIIFFVIAFSALMDSYNQGVFAGFYLDRMAVAVNLAQEKIEELRRGTYASVVAGTTTDNPVSGFAVFRRRTIVTLVAANPNSTYKLITVTVSWLSKGSTSAVWGAGYHDFALSTYLADY